LHTDAAMALEVQGAELAALLANASVPATHAAGGASVGLDGEGSCIAAPGAPGPAPPTAGPSESARRVDETCTASAGCAGALEPPTYAGLLELLANFGVGADDAPLGDRAAPPQWQGLKKEPLMCRDVTGLVRPPVRLFESTKEGQELTVEQRRERHALIFGRPGSTEEAPAADGSRGEDPHATTYLTDGRGDRWGAPPGPPKPARERDDPPQPALKRTDNGPDSAPAAAAVPDQPLPAAVATAAAAAPARARRGLVRVHPVGFACVLCGKADPPPIASGCGCPGREALAHVACRAAAAAAQEGDDESRAWWRCGRCDRDFTRRMHASLAELWFTKTRAEPADSFIRCEAAYNLADAYFAMGRYAEAHSLVTQAYALVAQGQQAEAPPVPATQASDGPAASGTAAESSKRPPRRRVPTARYAAASAAAAAAKPATGPKPKAATMPGAIRQGFCIFEEGSCSNKAVYGGKPGLCKAHGGGYRCVHPGCQTVAAGYGPRKDLCIAHGGGFRCVHPGCQTVARSGTGPRKDFCKAHGGGVLCVHPGCQTAAAGYGPRKDLCIATGGGIR
jgi:hypothetical protein